MTKSLIPFCVFLLILFLFSYPFKYGTSIAPGWHTTIYPRYFILTRIIAIILLLVIIGYWILSRRNDKINWVTFVVHFLITGGAAVFINFPDAFLYVNPNNFEMAQIALRRLSSLPIACSSFIVAQTLFFIYFFRTKKRKNETTSN
jgi:hypothetical protein